MAIVNQKNMALGLFVLLASGSAVVADEQPDVGSLATDFFVHSYPDSISSSCEVIVLDEGQTYKDVRSNSGCVHGFQHDYEFFSEDSEIRFVDLVADELKRNPAMIPVITELTNMMKNEEISLDLFQRSFCETFFNEAGELDRKQFTDSITYSIGAGYSGTPDPNIIVCGNPEQASIIKGTAKLLAQSFISSAAKIDTYSPDNGYRDVYKGLYERLNVTLEGGLPEYPNRPPVYHDLDELGVFEAIGKPTHE